MKVAKMADNLAALKVRLRVDTLVYHLAGLTEACTVELKVEMKVELKVRQSEQELAERTDN